MSLTMKWQSQSKSVFFFHVLNALLTKLIQLTWLDIDLDSILGRKHANKENLAIIQLYYNNYGFVSQGLGTTEFTNLIG